MPETTCTDKIYSEEYIDYLLEYFELDQTLQGIVGECANIVANRFAVVYREGGKYVPHGNRDICVIPHCYGLLSSQQVLESTGVARVQRQPGLNLYGQGVLVGFVDTGERVIILSGQYSGSSRASERKGGLRKWRALLKRKKQNNLLFFGVSM